jgi:hypothetical protein
MKAQSIFEFLSAAIDGSSRAHHTILWHGP